MNCGGGGDYFRRLLAVVQSPFFIQQDAEYFKIHPHTYTPQVHVKSFQFFKETTKQLSKLVTCCSNGVNRNRLRRSKGRRIRSCRHLFFCSLFVRISVVQHCKTVLPKTITLVRISCFFTSFLLFFQGQILVVSVRLALERFREADFSQPLTADNTDLSSVYSLIPGGC